MHYVMTDIHGEYELYIEMLEEIGFSDDDTLYILGDCCDRGYKSAEIYLDIMNRSNVYLIKGNHEVMALKGIEYVLKTGIWPDKYTDDFDVRMWTENGGMPTLDSLHKLSEKELRLVYEYIKSLPYYLEAKVNGKRFLMVHAGIADFKEDKPMEDYSEYDLVWYRPDFNKKLWQEDNRFLLVGHTPTFTIKRGGSKAEIYRGRGDIIVLDCGAAYYGYGGRLACFCLETMQAKYVSAV